MTDPQIPQAVPPLDPANQLLAPGPSQLATGVVTTPEGQRMVLTVRTGSATVTVFLARDDALAWAENIRSTAVGMSGLFVVGSLGMPDSLIDSHPFAP